METNNRLRDWMRQLCELDIPQATFSRRMKVEKARLSRWLSKEDPRPLSTDEADRFLVYVQALHALTSQIVVTPALVPPAPSSLAATKEARAAPDPFPVIAKDQRRRHRRLR